MKRFGRSFFFNINFLKRRKPKKLSEMDELVMNKLDSSEKNIGRPTKPNVRKLSQMSCQKCSGELKIVNPIKKLKGRVLFECASCHEREYKKVDEEAA